MNYDRLISQIQADARRERKAGFEQSARHMESRIEALKAERAEVFRRETTTPNPKPSLEPVKIEKPLLPPWLIAMGADETMEQAIRRAERERR